MLLGKNLLGMTWSELRRRKVVRSAAAYAVFAFVVLQLAEITFEPLGLPAWAMTWTVLAAILGFPVVLVLAWFFDLTARGIERDNSAGGKAGAAFAVAIVLLTVGGIGFWLSTVYEPRDRSGPSLAQTAREESVSTAPPNTIAVLPFDDMSAQADQRHFADGIAEELLDRLARLHGLRVAARTSSFALRGFAGDVREIGRLLNVRWVLEGSVRKSEGKIRITAQLIDAADGYHAWSETYERPDQDLFALQDEVTAAIAGQLGERIGGVGGATEGAMSTRNPQALELYLQGRQAWRQRGPAALVRAIELFEQALALDPEFAHAWSGLADAYLVQADYGLRALDEAVARAEPAAVRAVSLRPDLGEAWASIGLLRLLAGQLDPARRSLEEAMRLAPRYEMAPMWLAGIHGRQGRLDRQREVLLQAIEISPLEPVVNVNLAAVLVAIGDRDDARARIERQLAIQPDEPLLLRSLADIEFASGRLEPALRLARQALAAEPAAPASLLQLARTLATLEDFAGAEALAAQMPAGSHQQMILRQQLRLRQGDGVLSEVLAKRVERLLAARPGASPADREALEVAGMARLLAGAHAEAAALLGAAVGSPEQLAEDFSLLEPASLLAVALRASGAAEQADQWDKAVLEQAQRLLEQAGASADSHYIRALLAIAEGDRDAALQALQRAWDAGFRQRWQLRHDPRLGELRGSAPVQALDQRIGEELERVRQTAGIVTS
jgi:TolB-like protein/Tfp pilus assembly protein PilF